MFSQTKAKIKIFVWTLDLFLALIGQTLFLFFLILLAELTLLYCDCYIKVAVLLLRLAGKQIDNVSR